LWRLQIEQFGIARYKRVMWHPTRGRKIGSISPGTLHGRARVMLDRRRGRRANGDRAGLSFDPVTSVPE
jgi:hypothetical protein